MGGWSKGPAHAHARQGEKANKQRGLWRKLPAFAARARVCVCFLCICIVVLKKSFFLKVFRCVHRLRGPTQRWLARTSAPPPF